MTVSMDEARATYEALEEVRPSLQHRVPVALIDHYVGGVDEAAELEGRGRATFALRYLIEGDFATGTISHSPGALHYPNGYAVTGPLTAEGVPTGQNCTIRWPTGESYRGALVNGVRHGRGCQLSACGTARYEGDWWRGKRQGFGTQLYADGSRYEGEWAGDARHGHGTLWYASGDCYEGEWSHGERVGQGCMGWHHGASEYVEIYQGAWVAGEPHGIGSSTYIRPTAGASTATEARPGGSARTGAAVKSLPPSQYAAPETAIVNRYVGEFAHGERHGRGTFLYADGSSYEGQWEHGERVGKGLITTTVGSVVLVTSGAPPSTATLADGADLDLDVETVNKDGSGARRNRNAQLVPEVSVDDLCGLNDGTEAQFATTITSLLLRYNTSLRALFTRYANAYDEVELLFTPPDWWRQRTPGHIGVSQLLRLLSDAGVLGGVVTTATFVQCVATAVENATAAVRARLGDELTEDVVRANQAVQAQLFQLEGCLHYRTFAECIIRLAPLVCVGPRYHTLGDQVGAFVETYLRAPLTAHPLFPVSRRHMAVLRPYAAQLANLFDRAVKLQLPQKYPFLPASMALNGVQPVLQRVGVSPLQAVAHTVATSARQAAVQRKVVPPGLSEPRGEMAEALYKAANGPRDKLYLSTSAADRDLTVVDFVEVLASTTELVGQRTSGRSSADASTSFESTLMDLVVPTFEQYLSTL